MNEYKSVQKLLEKNKKKVIKKNSILISTVNKTLISIIMLLICLCGVKINSYFKNWIDHNIYQTNISFAAINKTYEKYLGSVLPIKENSKTSPVFNEQLVYEKKESYKDGVKLTVKNNYLVPILESGIVVFMGNKDNYGKTVIIQQVNGIDLWYVGVDYSNLKMYDYVEKGSLLGETISNEFYLYYQKSGEFIDYKEYLG